jgi:hypothetical protein
VSTKKEKQEKAAAEAAKAAAETLENGTAAAEAPAADATGLGPERTQGESGGEALRPEKGETVDTGKTESAETPATAGSTDIAHVYCKLPAGLTFRLPDGKRLVLQGSNASSLIGGYGVTRVPAALWGQVKALFGSMPAFTKGLIFDESTASRGLARAREQTDIKNGFEGVDPKNPGPGVTPDDGK